MLPRIEETGIQVNKRLERPKLVFVHVPKTAGTTLVHALKETNYVLHQDKRHPVKDYNKYEIIFGHFHPSKYNGDIPKAIFLRNPVDRMVSHYCHWKTRLVNDNKNMIMCFPERTAKFPEDITLIEFAKRVGNIYKKYTDYDLNQFAFVGFTEFFNIHTNKFSSFFNLGISAPFDSKRVSLFKRRLKNKECSELSRILLDDLKFYYNAFYQRG